MTAKEAAEPLEEPPKAPPPEGPEAEEARRVKKELKVLAIAFGCALLFLACLGVSSAVLGAYLDARDALGAGAPGASAP